MVNPNTVKLQPLTPSAGVLNAASEQIFVAIDSILEKYESKRAADLKVRHPGWKVENPIEEDIDLSYERAFATWAVSQIAKYCKTTWPDVFAHVECLSKPRQMAIAKAACPAGMLVISPEVTKVTSCLAKKMAELTVDTRAKVTLVHTAHPTYAFFVNPWVDQKRAVAFWFVEATDDPNKANMTYATASYDCTSGAELTPPTGVQILALQKVSETAQTKERVTGKQTEKKVVDPPEDAHKDFARVSVLVNHKPLAKGDVLWVYHKPEKTGEKRARPSAPMTLSKVMRTR